MLVLRYDTWCYVFTGHKKHTQLDREESQRIDHAHLIGMSLLHTYILYHGRHSCGSDWSKGNLTAVARGEQLRSHGFWLLAAVAISRHVGTYSSTEYIIAVNVLRSRYIYIRIQNKWDDTQTAGRLKTIIQQQ